MYRFEGILNYNKIQLLVLFYRMKIKLDVGFLPVYMQGKLKF